MLIDLRSCSRAHACALQRVYTSTASQLGHLAATYSLIPIMRLPIPTNYEGVYLGSSSSATPEGRR